MKFNDLITELRGKAAANELMKNSSGIYSMKNIENAIKRSFKKAKVKINNIKTNINTKKTFSLKTANSGDLVVDTTVKTPNGTITYTTTFVIPLNTRQVTNISIVPRS